MNHRLLKAILLTAIVGATVVGVARWEWPPSTSTTLIDQATTTAQTLLPRLGPSQAEAQEGVAAASPTEIVVNQGTDVVVRIKITDTRLIAGSVNLQSVDATGRATVMGTLNDAGANGDAIANDKVYSIRQRLQAAVIAPLRFQVTWALKGVLKRSASNTVSILVTVVLLPPDPGAAGKQMLAGIDSDNDGVRDDVQRYIALTYPESEKKRAALTQYAKAVQQSLLDSGSGSADQLTKDGMNHFNAIACIHYIVGPDAGPRLFRSLRSILLNTSPRSQAYLAADAYMVGNEPSIRSDQDLKQFCVFDPGGLSN